jgi:hypothetical protein
VDASDKGVPDCPIRTRVLILTRAATGGGRMAVGPRHSCQVGARSRQVGPGGGRSLTSESLQILFLNEIKPLETELTVGKIARMGEKFPEICWIKKV